MIIAVASGKGGTGKTTIATSLALALPTPVLFLDCDVEAPNAHLFLRPDFEQNQEVGLLIPEVDEERCTFCGECANACQYHAIAILGKKALVFPQLCHGCGSCTMICPEQAITEKLDVMGVLESGTTKTGIRFGRGVLNVGEPMAVPVIRQLKKWMESEPEQNVILDASPGTSCPVVATVRGADFLILVTEPTPFGLHDLRLAAQVARELAIPAGVVVNRENGAYPDLDEYCESESLPILLRIPYDRAIAEGIAQGKNLVEVNPGFIQEFRSLFMKIQGLCKH